MDNFYEERYQQIKNDLFIGDENHVLGKSGSFVFLYRLFSECYDFEDIYGVLDNIRRNDLTAKKNPFVRYDTITKHMLKKHKGYLVMDKDNKVSVDFWNGESFTYVKEPKLIMLYADVDNYQMYLQN